MPAVHETSIEVDPSALVHHAIAAVKGLHADPDSAMSAFEQHFGPGSAKGLRTHILGGPDDEGAEGEKPSEGFLDDESDGMADLIPASGPRGPDSVRLAGGEFIIPADVCADLGSGNGAAGAKALESLIAFVRQMRHGTTEQPPQVDGKGLISQFLSKMYGEGE